MPAPSARFHFLLDDDLHLVKLQVPAAAYPQLAARLLANAPVAWSAAAAPGGRGRVDVAATFAGRAGAIALLRDAGAIGPLTPHSEEAADAVLEV